MKPSIPKKFIIGTRGSLLALTQAGQAKKQLEQMTGYEFEFRVIKTQGDQVTDKALWQLEGKDFFTKELDRALIDKEIDMVIHSYKDLGSERPADIKLAAITKRQFPHDILLIKKTTVDKLQSAQIANFVVGTSAPRRISNITHSLKSFLPFSSKSAQNLTQSLDIECKVLRGNVNSRIEKLNDDNYDAIILALAGIERLALTDSSAQILKELTKDLTFKVLPLEQFPPAASQGSLAIEVHKDNKELFELLQCVHHDQSALEISKERQSFNSYGGGCHLAVGIHVKSWGEQLIEYQKGEFDNKRIEKKFFVNTKKTQKVDPSKLFLGFPETMVSLKKEHPRVLWDTLSQKHSFHDDEKRQTKHIFVTSSYCFETLEKYYGDHYMWASGSRTHKKLSQLGYWVLSDASSLGLKEITTLLDSKALQMMLSQNEKPSLAIMTERDTSPVPGHDSIPTYQRHYKQASDQFMEMLKSKTHFYWTSYPQFEYYSMIYPELKTSKDIYHYCGLGKTYSQISQLTSPSLTNLTPLVSFKELLP